MLSLFLSAWALSVASPNASMSQVATLKQDLKSGGHQHRARQQIPCLKWTHSCCVLETILATQVTSLLPLQPRSLVFQIFSNEIIYQSLRYKNGKNSKQNKTVEVGKGGGHTFSFPHSKPTAEAQRHSFSFPGYSLKTIGLIHLE